MKSLLKVVAVGSAVALAVAMTPSSYAGERFNRGGGHDDGWATFGKVVTGVAAVGLLAHTIDHVARHAPAIPVAVPVPVCPPAQCAPAAVCESGYWNTVIVPAQYGWVRSGCTQRYVVIRPECHQRVWVPGWVEHHDGGRFDYRDNRGYDHGRGYDHDRGGHNGYGRR